MKNIKTLFLFPIFLFTMSCLLETAIKLPFSGYTPKNIYDGWEISNPSDEDINASSLEGIFMDLHENDIWQIKSLLVFRNGKLVAESYMKDTDEIIKKTAIWSCSKQFTAIITGIAIDQNLIALNDPVSSYLPQAISYGKENITIRNLLTMKSGIDFNNDGANGETIQLLWEKPKNSLDFILGLGMRSSPGVSFNYNDGDPHIISAIIQTRTGKTMKLWADDVLFGKIGITNLDWMTYKDGITLGAFGILTTPREMAKIGQLVMDDGVWNGEQIVSAAWINNMTDNKVSSAETNETNITFGYYWWGDSNRNISFMRGHGGQYVFINKNKKLMVVITSEPNTQGPFQLSLNQGLSIYDKINNITY